jgi:hypothetical protein
MVTVRRGTSVLASVLATIGYIIVGIIVIHIVLSVLGANPDNAFASFFRTLAGGLSLGLSNLFTPSDPKLNVLINFGIAALIWLLITWVVVRLVRRLG